MAFVDPPVVLRVAIGIVFLWSGAAKVAQWNTFLFGVRDYRIIPETLERLARPVAALTIAVELFLGVSHLLGVWLHYAIPIGVVTLSLFGAAVTVNLMRQRHMPCYCSGGTTEKLSLRTAARVAMILAAESTLAFTSTRALAGVDSHIASVLWAIVALEVAAWGLQIDNVVTLVLRTLRVAR